MVLGLATGQRDERLATTDGSHERLSGSHDYPSHEPCGAVVSDVVCVAERSKMGECVLAWDKLDNSGARYQVAFNPLEHPHVPFRGGAHALGELADRPLERPVPFCSADEGASGAGGRQAGHAKAGRNRCVTLAGGKLEGRSGMEPQEDRRSWRAGVGMAGRISSRIDPRRGAFSLVGTFFRLAEGHLQEERAFRRGAAHAATTP